MILPCINIFTFFSSFPIIIGGIAINSESAVNIDHGRDGEQFVEKIIHGEKISYKPGYFVFTAPYRLCEGGCKQSENFAMHFPLYVGNRGKQVYKDMYRRDYEKLRSSDGIAPFMQRTTAKERMKVCVTKYRNPVLSSFSNEPATAELTTTASPTYTKESTTPAIATTAIETYDEYILPEKIITEIMPDPETATEGRRCPKLKPRICKKHRSKVKADIVGLETFSRDEYSENI